MSGIYIHIPFCKKKCAYCNFFSIASAKQLCDFIKALQKEIICSKSYISGQVETIYLGGGTPSMVPVEDLQRIFQDIYHYFQVAPNPEITLEANPDHLTDDYLVQLRKYTPVNRISIGIQSFFEENLQYLGRTHASEDALASIRRVRNHGFENLSVDLIYGYPTLTDERWLQNLQTVIDLQIPHLSCYALTIEPHTILDVLIRQGKKQAPEEETAVRHFELLIQMMENHAYQHYEIANFALEGKQAIHNTNYWKQEPYLGLGPSAHGYNGSERRWNVANVDDYIDRLTQTPEQLWFEKETLTPIDCFNEYIMLSLRTCWGIDKNYIISHFGRQAWDSCDEKIKAWQSKGYITETNNIYQLSNQGKLFADMIASDLFFESF